jgi:hypothetical protein
MNNDGSGPHQVTTPAFGDSEPAFSPDGTHIVFDGEPSNTSERLYVQSLTGGPASLVTSGFDSTPSWGRIPTPSIDSAPSLAGTARAGHTLTASAGATSWGGSTAFQWLRCAASCSPIAGATGASYRATNADIGSRIEVRQTQASAGGSVYADSAPSAAVAPEPGAAIAGKLGRLSGGRVVAQLSCPAEQSAVCQGRLSLAAAGKHGRRIGFASGAFQLTAGTTAKVTLRATKRGRALLASERRLRLVATLTTKDDAGNTTKAKAAVAVAHR